MSNCLFCKIINREMNVDFIHKDDQNVAFKDINPQAPFHILIIPKKEINTLNNVTLNDKELMGHIILTATNLAKELNIDKSGYRLVFNCNEDGGQSVYHIHLHLIGGRKLKWPPG